MDFDHGLNKAINKLRDALGDSADHPRFIETLPRRGYRFIAVLEEPDTEASAENAALFSGRKRWIGKGALTLAAACFLAMAVYFLARPWEPRADPPGGKIMLTVLPFENLGGDPDQEYFSDGLTEEMISQLGRLHPERLGVIARTSAMHYKNTQKRIDQIGEELGVGYVLEGTVRRADDRVRITAQLVQVGDQTQLWAETYERRLADIFAIQNEVAARIARSLTVELLPARAAALARRPTESLAAHEAYLKGRYFWNKRTQEGLNKGLAYFQQATELDEGYALAFVGLADSYNMLADYGAMAPKDAFPRAMEAARRALTLDDSLAEAHTSLTWARWVYELDWSAGEQGFQRAIELNPGYAFSYQLHAHYWRALGRHEEALALAKQARELDPLSLIINAVLGWHHYIAREPDLAIEQCRRTIEMDPSFSRVHSYLGWAYLEKAMYSEAITELEKARDLSGASPSRTAELAQGYAVAGRSKEARRLLAELEEFFEQRWVEADLIAKIYAGLGENDEAFKWLEKAYLDRSTELVMLREDPLLDPLRDDARFDDLLSRIGFPSD